MYTGLEVKCTPKLEMVDLLNQLHETGCWSKIKNPPSFVAEWAKIHRAGFIPFGAQCVWKGDGFSKFTSDCWHFDCSLKNYEGEIENFLKNVLPYLIESLELCRTQYEAIEEVTHYKLLDGNIVFDKIVATDS